jgi:acetyl-CoA acyltransferase
MAQARDAVIVAFGRSAIGKAFKGSLRETHPATFGAQVLNGVLNKVPQLGHRDIDDVIVGCAVTTGPQGVGNFAKIIMDRAGINCDVPGQTVNRLCSSALNAIAIGCNAIIAGQADVIVAGGCESISLVPVKPAPQDIDLALWKAHPSSYMVMGQTAEVVARRYNITRQMQDEFACESQVKAAKATAANEFADEIIPVAAYITVTNEKGESVLDQSGNPVRKAFIFDRDECPRANTTMEGLASLKPAFAENGSVTAGNASQMSDAASFVVVMSGEKADALGLKKLAKFRAFAVTGCEADEMGVGPIKAVPKALKMAGLELKDIDVIELNEAFASQAVYVVNTLGLDVNKLNLSGGAISFGHAYGSTGAWLTMRAIRQLQKRNGRFGLVTMCVGGGMGAAGIFELLR